MEIKDLSTEVRSKLVWFTGEEVKHLQETGQALGNNKCLIRLDYTSIMRILNQKGIDEKLYSFLNSRSQDIMARDLVHGKSFLLYTLLREPQHWIVP